MKTFKEKYLDKNYEIDICKIKPDMYYSKWRDTEKLYRWTHYILVSGNKEGISSYFKSRELILIPKSVKKIFITFSNPYVQYQFKARLKGTNKHFWFIATKHSLIKYILDDEQKLLYEVGELFNDDF